MIDGVRQRPNEQSVCLPGGCSHCLMMAKRIPISFKKRGAKQTSSKPDNCEHLAHHHHQHQEERRTTTRNKSHSGKQSVALARFRNKKKKRKEEGPTNAKRTPIMFEATPRPERLNPSYWPTSGKTSGRASPRAAAQSLDYCCYLKIMALSCMLLMLIVFDSSNLVGAHKPQSPDAGGSAEGGPKLPEATRGNTLGATMIAPINHIARPTAVRGGGRHHKPGGTDWRRSAAAAATTTTMVPDAGALHQVNEKRPVDCSLVGCWHKHQPKHERPAGPVNGEPASRPSNHLDSDDVAPNQRGRRSSRSSRAMLPLASGEQSGGPPSTAANMQPKLVQWSKEAVQYYEGSTLVLSCSLAMSAPLGSQLKFAWFRAGRPLTSSPSSLGGSMAASPSGSSAIGLNNNNNNNNNRQMLIETLADYSFLRLADLRPSDSGAYTCAVSNQLGQEDRTTSQVIVNVKLKWLPGARGTAEASAANNQSQQISIGHGHELKIITAGQSTEFECNAAGQPRPRVRWFRLGAPGGATNFNSPPRPPTTSVANDHHQVIQTATGRRQSAPAPATTNSFALINNNNQFKFDESQIRAALIQADSLQAFTAGEPAGAVGQLLSSSSSSSSSPSSSSLTAAAAASSGINSNSNLFQRFELVNYKDGLAILPPGHFLPRYANLGLPQVANLASNGSIATTTTTAGQQLQATPINMRWWRIETNQGVNQNEIYSRLTIDRADPSASGIYECEVISGGGSGGLASSSMIGDLSDNDDPHQTQRFGHSSNGMSQSAANLQAGDKLRRLFGLLINVDPLTEQLARLIAELDQPQAMPLLPVNL